MTKKHTRWMKKLIASITLSVTLLIFFTSVTLAALPGYSTSTSVSTDENGYAQFDIVVFPVGLYAGVQFELILGSGVSIESVSFDKGRNSGVLGPVFARGSYFFSLFSGTNEFEGALTCTVNILYTGSEPATVTLADIQVHSVNTPGNVSTQSASNQTGSGQTDSSTSIIVVNPREHPPTLPTPTPPPQGGDSNDSGTNANQGAPGRLTAAGESGLDETEYDESDMLAEFNINISTDPEDTTPVNEETDSESDTVFMDIADEQTPLAELLIERHLTWIWIVVVTFVSAAAASVISERKRRSSKSLEAVAEESVTEDNAAEEAAKNSKEMCD